MNAMHESFYNSHCCSPLGFFLMGGGLFFVSRFAVFLLFLSAASLLKDVLALSLFLGAHLMFLH